jgi:hypothetical protein
MSFPLVHGSVGVVPCDEEARGLVVGGVTDAGLDPGTPQSIFESDDQLTGLGGRGADGDDPELVATEAGHHVLGPHAGRQGAGGAADVVIARSVTVRIIDNLEGRGRRR